VVGWYGERGIFHDRATCLDKMAWIRDGLQERRICTLVSKTCLAGTYLAHPITITLYSNQAYSLHPFVTFQVITLIEHIHMLSTDLTTQTRTHKERRAPGPSYFHRQRYCQEWLRKQCIQLDWDIQLMATRVAIYQWVLHCRRAGSRLSQLSSPWPEALPVLPVYLAMVLLMTGLKIRH
jgi:hypothetical protein